MLIPFADKDGLEIWISPIHVRCVREWRGMLGSRAKGAEIWFSYSHGFSALHVNEPAAIVAQGVAVANPAAYFPAISNEQVITPDSASHFNRNTD